MKIKSLILQQPWNWKVSGLALGLCFVLAAALVKPIGVSTQFVILDGILWKACSAGLVREDPGAKSGYASTNAYLNKSGGKYAAHVAQPLNYGLVFVLAMVAGGFMGGRLQSREARAGLRKAPAVWVENMGPSRTGRSAAVFFGGVLVLFGARLAGGCTSGHMMSGMMQTSLSGYLFALGAFAVAIPAALLLFRKGR